MNRPCPGARVCLSRSCRLSRLTRQRTMPAAATKGSTQSFHRLRNSSFSRFRIPYRRHCQKVIALSDKELQYALVLCVEDAVECESRVAPRPRRIEYLDQRNGALAIGAKRNAPGFIGAGEVPV